MIETWLTVVGYPDYEVSNLGRVQSYKQWRGRPTPRLLTSSIGNCGYPVVTIENRPSRRVHVLVLEAFVGPRPAGHVARHLDGDRSNSRLDNLAWGTYAQNEADKLSHGTGNQGRRHPQSKLTNEEVAAIRSAEGCTQRALSVRYNISQSQVCQIRRYRAWRHI